MRFVSVLAAASLIAAGSAFAADSYYRVELSSPILLDGSAAAIAPVLNDLGDVELTVGEPWEMTPTLRAGEVDIWTVFPGTEPSGLRYHLSTGTIEGSPLSAGTTDFTVRGANGSGHDEKTFRLSVFDAVSAAPPPVVNVSANATLSTKVSAAGGKPPFTFRWITPQAERPAWLDLQNTGTLAGTAPASAETWTGLEVAVEDSRAPRSAPASVSFDLSVTLPRLPAFVAGIQGSPFLTLFGSDGETIIRYPSAFSSQTEGVPFSLEFSPDKSNLAVGHSGSPYLSIYRTDGDALVELPSPPAPAGDAQGVAYSPDGSYLAVAHSNHPFVSIYKRNGNSYTRLANPDVLPSGIGRSVEFSPDGTLLAVGHTNSPKVTVYRRNGDSFTKTAFPEPAGGSTATGVSFSPDGTHLVASLIGSPYIAVFKKDGDQFVPLANPATLPPGNARGMSYSADGGLLAVPHEAFPYISVYRRSGDVYTKLANPSSLPTGTAWSAKFSSDGMFLAVSHSQSPYMTLYRRNGSSLAKVPNPSPLPGGETLDVSFR